MKRILVALLFIAALLSLTGAQAADQFFAGDGSTLTASKWGASAAGPFTAAFTANNVANFATVNGTGSGAAGISVSAIVATENFTYSSPSGTLLTGGTVASITVSSGKTLNLSSISLSTAAGTGFTKNDLGALFTANVNAYPAGFTLNAGSLIAGAVNAMGNGGALNINGGAIGANGNRDFTTRYSGITIGGDFQLGVLASAVSVATDASTLTFGNNVALGAASRTITIGNNGTHVLSGIISGSAGVGLTIARLSSATGQLTLSGANTYDGKTTVNAGRANINTDSSLGTAPGTFVADQLTLDNAGQLHATVTLNMNRNRGMTIGAGGGRITSAGITTIFTLSNNITGAGSITNTAGAINFNGTNSFQGDLVIVGSTGNNPTIRLNTDYAAGLGKIIISPAADQNFSLRNSGVSSSAVTNDVVLNTGSLSTKFISLDSDSGSTFTLSGKLSGSAPVSIGRGDNNTANGGGIVVLTGDNSGYSGAITAVAGTLRVNSPGSLASASAVGVSSGATLGGTGTINGTVTVASGGTLAPGASVGTLTLGAPPSLGGTLAMEINQTDLTSDKLNLSSGVFTYGGTLALTVTAGTLVGGEVFDLFDEVDAGDSSGSFAITTSPTLAAGLNWWQGRLATEGKIVLNRAPTAVNTNYTRAFGLPLKIKISELLAISSDPDSADGDAVVFQGVNSGGEGATVTTDATYIFYTPANNNNDTLIYTIGDNRGGSTATANIAITVGAQQTSTALSITADEFGAVHIIFQAVHGFHYDVERSTTVDFASFVVISSNVTPDANARITVDDTPGPGSFFYRLKWLGN